MTGDDPIPTTLPAVRPRRVVISHVEPEVEGGRFPAKRIVGDTVVVTADIFADSHDLLAAVVRYRHEKDTSWSEAPMRELVNDRWRGEFRATQVGRYEVMLQAWIDRFATWRRDFQKKVEAGQDVESDLQTGASLVDEASRRAIGPAARDLALRAALIRHRESGTEKAVERALEAAQSEQIVALMAEYPDRRHSTTYEKTLAITVGPERARFSAWYEMFPRSASPEPGRHGTFADCEARLPYVAAMGFDVLYLPPIHPIGVTNRKGKNGRSGALPSDPGSVWAIGSAEGGHKSIHPALGTLDDFRRLVAKAREHGLDVALDVAYQCSPDHPYVQHHPEWFRRRPDGSIQCAGNPPHTYDDIYPFDFESEDWEELWEELKSILVFWIEQGVKMFRVDNPHTKPFAFWEWLIGEIKRDYPDVILLAESFTRPNSMYRLTALGFTHSYTYFTWRTSKHELVEYFTELNASPVREHFRPHLWPTTPDVLPEHLQAGGRPTFISRLVLAATLAANYGIYGPAYELCENTPAAPGSEQLLNSEMFEIRHWDIAPPGNLSELIGRINWIRRENPALGRDGGLRFHSIANDQIIAYTRATEDLANVVLVIVNLDPRYTQAGAIDLPLGELGLDPSRPYEVHDLLSDHRYTWHGPQNYVELDPSNLPAHIFKLR
ncbi:MAG TPA: alpha-1,4-glucan--maltose-1-phosphate maltosyltransferase [Terriglobia bacterium]|nr:alpha-1,4-glucan--maltose-1-phosphate maltosyltransferase [Terriglobia bacterium]